MTEWFKSVCFLQAKNNVKDIMWYVMQSREISLKLIMWYLKFLSFQKCLLERFLLLKIPPELDQCFQNYKQLKGSQNNSKQQKFILLSGYIAQYAPNFRLILLDCNAYMSAIHRKYIMETTPSAFECECWWCWVCTMIIPINLPLSLRLLHTWSRSVIKLLFQL